MPPASPGIGESRAAITGNALVEGSTGGLAEVNAAPHPSPEAIIVAYDGEPASGRGSYQSLASVDVLSQCSIRREHPRVQLHPTKWPRSGRDQSNRSEKSRMASAPARSKVVPSKMAANPIVWMSYKRPGDNRKSELRSPGSFPFRPARRGSGHLVKNGRPSRAA